MNLTATFFFGALTGAAAMLVVMLAMLASIKREVRLIRELRELEREIESNHEQRTNCSGVHEP